MHSSRHNYNSPFRPPSTTSKFGDDGSLSSLLSKYNLPLRSASETTKNAQYDYASKRDYTNRTSDNYSPLTVTFLSKLNSSSWSSPLEITRNTKYDYTNRTKDSYSSPGEYKSPSYLSSKYSSSSRSSLLRKDDLYSSPGNTSSYMSKYNSPTPSTLLDTTKTTKYESRNTRRRDSDRYSPPRDRSLSSSMNKYGSPTRSALLDTTKTTKYESQNRNKDIDYSSPGDRSLNSFMNKYGSPTSNGSPRRSSLLDTTTSTKYESKKRNKDIDYSPPGDMSIGSLMNKYGSPRRSSLLEITTSTKYDSPPGEMSIDALMEKYRTPTRSSKYASQHGDEIQALMTKYSTPSSFSPPTYFSSNTSPLLSTSLEATTSYNEYKQKGGYLSTLGDPMVANFTPWWIISKKDFPEINKLIWENDVDTLKELLETADLKSVTQESAEGCIHLHEAAYYGFLDCLKLLVAAFPEMLNRRTVHKQTPLLLAVHRKQVDCVECLLRAGADPNLADKHEETPIYVACMKDCEQIVELLLRFGASPTRTTLNGLTPLHEAAAYRNLTIVQRLVRAKAQVNARSRWGIEPVFTAAQGGCPEVLSCLIHHGANVNASASDGATPLFEAARWGHEEVVEILLAHGADANLLNVTGLTPLHIAAKNGHERVVALLISATELRSINESGISPIHLAAECDREDILEILIQAQLDVNATLSPAYSLKYEDRRSTALIFAVRQDNWEAVSMLLEAGADPNLDVFNPLFFALSSGDRDMVSLLLEYGANVNATVPTHATVFPGALLFVMNHLAMMKLLLDHGCDAASCFECVYGDLPHPPVKRNRTSGYSLHLHGPEAPHETAVQFCETLADPYNTPWAGPIIELLLEYTGKVKLCSRLIEILDTNKDWAHIKEKTKPLHSLMHLSRLRIHELVGRHRIRHMHTLPLPERLIKFLLYDNSEAEDFINYGFD
ncbi:ankyrin repeat and SOCS box protein 2-like isoform X2 [Engraulis encrasicolus]|uniref:ankyrin repeat and SOCS box protein 2-like isoform X2 n=1 Tax=Engraulis encrasicolus TaxID=184585 RepID=UPI002FD45B26